MKDRQSSEDEDEVEEKAHFRKTTLYDAVAGNHVILSKALKKTY